jgi:LPS-assembly lipoprotein
MRKPSNRWPRRAALGLLAGGAVALLVGCGFKLRGTGVQMSFSSLRLEGPVSPGMARTLAAQLTRTGVTVIRPDTTPATSITPQAILTILLDQRERVVVGTTAAGQVRELQLRHRVLFRLRTASGRDLIGDTELLQERELSFSETQVLGKEEEEALLFDDMLAGVVRQLMSRLAAVQRL